MEKRLALKMDKRMLTNKGFTLIEMIFVISIISITSFLTLSVYIPKSKSIDSQEKISQFFYQAKLNSMIYKEKTSITLSGTKLSYSSSSNNQTIYIKDGFAKKKYSFSYNANGNIYKASTVTYKINGLSINYVFQVGSGCFDIK